MRCIMCGTEIKTINEMVEKKSVFGTKNEFQRFKYCEKCGYKEPIDNTYSDYSNIQSNQQDQYKGLAITSIICGIASMFFLPYVLGVLGIIFGAVAIGNGSKSGMCIAGIVCGSISLLWAIILNNAFLSFLYSL